MTHKPRSFDVAYGDNIRLISNHMVNHNPAAVMPARLVVGAGFGAALEVRDGAPLTREELVKMRAVIDALLAPAPEAVVQVSIRSGASRGSETFYSYKDPSGELQPGDLVLVPFGVHDEPTIAVVKQLGRGAYGGPLKSVLAKFTEEEL